MHRRSGVGADVAGGPALLLQLGRLILRPRSSSPAAHAHRPSTSQVQVQPKPESEELNPHLEAQLSDRVHALWNQQIPLCIEVLLAPECPECRAGAREDRRPARRVLLERWTMRPLPNTGTEPPTFINAQWLLNAVRSQLHFSQLSAWLARLDVDDTPTERRRKLSRETCNYKKLEANCDQSELCGDERKLNLVYSITVAGDSHADFTRTPTAHTFPITDIGNKTLLKVVVEALRAESAPTGCGCRRASHDRTDLASRLHDLTIGNKFEPSHLQSSVVDDRMLTPCSENGKHRCSCDDESDTQKTNQPKKLDDRRLKEIAKYKRRLRKESKIRKLCDSTSSEGDQLKTKETHTSIPILQAARFDRFRAIGCYRNQTYLTLPASRIETKSPFIDTETPPPEFKRTNTVATQTDDIICPCGNQVEMKCDGCTTNKMVRSVGSYDLTAIENGARRKCEEDGKSIKKLKCDNRNSLVNDVVKRPKLRRILPVVDKIGQILSDRESAENDIKDLHLKSDDSVFSVPKETKRQKTYSVGDEDYVVQEKCDYGTFERCNMDSPTENDSFQFPKGGDTQVPSPTEMDRFRWRFDSAASMVFHSKTGLPLTSSPAPLRRGNNCFDFDDSINGVSGIKSALYRGVSAAPPPPAPRPPRPRHGPSAGLLGSFEESALKGRLEPVATVHGFTAELGASGAFCPPHKRLPVTVFFYAPGGTNAPYMGHINLGPGGYRVGRSGTVQVSLFNPHGTLVKMFVVLYSLVGMPPLATTFLRQRTLYLPAGAPPPSAAHRHKWLRYLIHLRFMTSKSGKLYLHTDIRIIVSRKADLDTATAHSAISRPLSTNKPSSDTEDTNSTNQRSPNRVFGGCGDFDGEKSAEICYENQNGVSYELRSFTYAPENPKYSPR